MSDDGEGVTIVGAGLIGQVAALALARSAGERVRLLDSRPVSQAPADNRVSAIGAASRRMLDVLGVWRHVEAEAQPILRMDLTDGPEADPLRPRLIAFEGPLETGEPFAHIVPNAALNQALACEGAAAGVTMIGEARVASAGFDGPRARLALADGRDFETELVVGADGVGSAMRAAAGIGAVDLPLRQWALSCMVRHERPHEGRAEQHFYPGGPLALLPAKGDRSSVVWTAPRDMVERLVAMDAADFEYEIVRRIGLRHGAITLEGTRHGFPLAYRMARAYAAPRLALIGDAAHSIHPLAGQGLNLGFKDAAALAEVVADARRLGRDAGSIAVLRAYERWRRGDSFVMGVATSGLNWLFSTDAPLVGPLRRLGLGLTDRTARLKRAFIAEASGTTGTLPRLLRGEPV